MDEEQAICTDENHVGNSATQQELNLIKKPARKRQNRSCCYNLASCFVCFGKKYHNTHVANACSEDIYVKVTSNAFGGTDRIGSNNASMKDGRKVDACGPEPGFSIIRPGNYLRFKESGRDGRVFVTIKVGSETINDNFAVGNDESVIVDAQKSLRHTKYGNLWIDIDGRSHDPSGGRNRGHNLSFSEI